MTRSLARPQRWLLGFHAALLLLASCVSAADVSSAPDEVPPPTLVPLVNEWRGTWSGYDAQGCNITTIGDASGEMVSKYVGCEDEGDNGVYAVSVIKQRCLGQHSGVYQDVDREGDKTCVYWSRTGIAVFHF